MSKRVLVADDERYIAKLIQRNLEREGHHVTVVTNGTQAIEELERNPTYSHIILDLMMPFTDGYEVLKWIRTHEQTRTAWVAIMSAQADALSRERLEHQPDLWVQKPIDEWHWF